MKRKTVYLRGQDVIDSRDVIARIEELERYRDESLQKAVEINDKLNGLVGGELTDEEREDLKLKLWTGADGTEYGETDDWLDDEDQELVALKELEEEASRASDWSSGATLILDSYFKQYAQDFAEDIGAIEQNDRWPSCHIDWDAAAEALQMDYFKVRFTGDTYWIRA